MAKILIIGTLPNSLINFRGDLLKAFVSECHEVTAMAEEDLPVVRSALFDIGVRFIVYPVQRNGLNPFKDLQTFFAFRRAYCVVKPDVVLAYNIKPITLGGLALYGNYGPRFYALVTGLGFAFQEGGLVRKILTILVTGLYRVALFRSLRVIFQNKDNMEYFINKKIVSEEKCSIINGSGVDLAHFALAPLPVEGMVFLTIGRLLVEKGFREYAKAAGIVKARFPDAVFRLVGPTDPSPDGISLSTINEWHAEGWVEYLGATDDVRPHLLGCHIFVLPSYHEGMPRSVLEAMAVGRPILTTDVPGCRETVKHGDNGFLVPKADIDSLVERMVWFIEHREEWQRMGRRSREIAEERFDVNKINREMQKIMDLKDVDWNFDDV